ncbi:MAG: hypothetical protein ACHQK8_07315 [Bacteroidia bacterium]
MKIKKYFIPFIVAILFAPFLSIAQDKEAQLTLKFNKADGNNVCQAIVNLENKPVKGVSVKLYVKRLFGLLPIGDPVSTDENGTAGFSFPKDLPCDASCKLTVIAKVEDDEKVGNIEGKGEIDWGIKPLVTKEQMVERSLSASRERAPIYFMVASDLIIVAIWGTLFYIVLQVFKIKKLGKIKQ